MRPGIMRSALLALTLVLGQWLALAHLSEHPTLQAEKPGCELCLHVQQLGSAAPTIIGQAPVVAGHEVPSQTARTSVHRAPPQLYPIRGPPHPFA